MGFVCRANRWAVFAAGFALLCGSFYAPAFGQTQPLVSSAGSARTAAVPPVAGFSPKESSESLAIDPAPQSPNPFLVKLAHGKTFGTSTPLDYTTLEVSRSVTRRPIERAQGSVVGEVRLAVLASYVAYYEGKIERIKKLDFHDGYELGALPKGRFIFPGHGIGLTAYLESGAGIGYVSETYRNSGSRWNWSLLAGCGIEKRLPGVGAISVGVQWRHLCNGNMWGVGDELHNSNSGTDMLQGLATFVHGF